MSVLGLVKKGLVIVVAFLVVSSVVLGALVATGVVSPEQPTVESVETSWGTVTQQRTNIQTTVVVDNPNPVGVPGVLDITYTAKMNSVVLASGEKHGIGLSPGRNTVDLTATIPNERISEWWVTHINNGERSTLTIRGQVSGPGGISREISRTRTIETNLLEGMTREGRTVVSAAGDRFLIMENQTASWGEATAERTPLTFSTTVTNVHDYGVTLDGMAYVVRMNNVTVGEGVTTDGVSVAPGETQRVDVRAALNTSKIADWWATHVRRGEKTTITVKVYGFIEQNGERKRVPLEVIDRKLAFTTNILSEGGSEIRALETDDDGPGFEKPTVGEITRRWGKVTDATTAIRTTVPVSNPNPENVTELADVTLSQTVTINDVRVAKGSSTYELTAGDQQLTHVVEMDNSKVPKWWVRHVNQGERSTIVIESRATVDAGFTKFDVPTTTRREEVSTNLLAGVESDEKRQLSVDGKTIGVIHSKSAEWKTATTQRTPFTVTIRVENTGRVPFTISDVDYTIGMNDVVVGEGTAPESYTVQPGETRRLTFTFVIDSQKMDEWWVTHVRNGEETVVDFDVVATVSAGTKSNRVRLTEKGPEDTVRTDFLNSTAAELEAVAVPLATPR